MTGSPPTHRLVLDAQATQSVVHHDRGIARYVREQARALLRRDRVAAVVLNPNLPFPRNLPQDLLTSPLLRWNTASELRRVAADADGPLAYYVMSPFEGALGSLPAHGIDGSMPVVATLYDLIPLLHPDQYLTEGTEARRYRVRTELLARADLVLSISEHSRRDAIEHLRLPPGRVATIGAGVSPFFTPAGPGEEPLAEIRRALPRARAEYVLTVAGADPRKNTEALLEAWARVEAPVRTARQLVVACNINDHTRRLWDAHARSVGLADDDVLFTGWISDEVLRSLYRAAELLVFPPLYEGFGLPAAEAMACGCPVITSSTSSLPEVVDWHEATFDPTDRDAMAAAITRGLTDEAFRAELQVRGRARAPELTWDAVADRTVQAVADHLDRAAAPARGRTADPSRTDPPLRLALVGPLPPTWSGIADYNARLLPELAGRCRLDVFTHGARPASFADLDCGWYQPHALGGALSPWSYDAVVYTVGNSDDHHDLYELAAEFPGILWMHDVRLPGLYLTYARARVGGQGGQFLRDRLRRQYRRRLPFEPGDDLGVERTEPYVEAGLGITRELVEVARGVVVSSSLAAGLLRLDQGPDARPAPAWVLPLASPPPAPLSEARARAPRAVVASFGLLDPIKAPDVLIRAAPTLLATVPEARVVLVGAGAESHLAELRALADELGVGDRVELTGRVDATAYERHLATATCAVQLRRATNGESSAAVLDCTAAGLPTVTNVAAAAELPPGTVDLLPPEVDAVALGHHLARLVTDPARLAELERAGRHHAETWGPAQVVDRLLAVVDEVGATTTGAGPRR